MNKGSPTVNIKRRSPLKFFAIVLAFAILASLPLAALLVYEVGMPEAYGDSYYAALSLKSERLDSLQTPKLVVIGGSSTAFGIDSKIAEKELGMPCVNFGLYAAFGLKCMLDLSLDSLGEGDIAVIAPEYSSQMFSEYVGYEYLLEAADSDSEIAWKLGIRYLEGFLAALPDFISSKRMLLASENRGGDGVYSLSSFDSYGDIVYPRENNIMDGGFSEDNLPEIGTAIVSDSFADMINSYARKARQRGAAVYFGFCPVNSLAVEATENIDKAGFLDALTAKLDCPVISSLDDHIMDAGYFYDSNYHMNESGAVYNTVLLVNDIKRELGSMTRTETEIPKPPALAGQADVISSGISEGIKYDITSEGAVITGLDEDALAFSDIVIPESIENCAVYKIAHKAFAHSKAERIVLPSSIRVMSSSIFDGASRLKRVELNAVALPEVGDGLTDGAPSGMKIAVPAEAYGNYITNYFWGRYSSVIIRSEGRDGE